MKLIHSLLRCKSAMHTYCVLKVKDSSSKGPEIVFSLWRLVETCVSHTFSILYSCFHHSLYV